MGLTFVSEPVQVRTPATSANLGPGFDTLGLALTLYDDLSARVTGDSWTVSVTGEGAGELPGDASHLVVRAMLATFDELGERPPGVAVECVNRIPQARGLGSSSAAIVGGVQLARALVRERLDDEAALRIAARLEGHPDNVARACSVASPSRGPSRPAPGPYGWTLPRAYGRRSSFRRNGALPRRRGPRCPPPCRTRTPRSTPAGPRCWCTR